VKKTTAQAEKAEAKPVKKPGAPKAKVSKPKEEK
jgi:hypothetical protein